jgi:C1A family cysteine protease
MPNGRSEASEIQNAIREAGAKWQASATALSELPESEKLLRLGYIPGPGEPSLEQRVELARAIYAVLGEAITAVGAPAAYDLRNVGGRNFITPVKDQGGCGSCVAFGSIAAVEGTLRVLRNDPNLQIDLSEAHLFYCLARAQGRMCSGPNGGWWVAPAMDCIRNPGVADDACYPYTAGDQNCTNLCADWQSRVFQLTGWHVINSVADMKTWISTKGPLTACFTVYNDFYSYRSGIYRHVTGNVVGGHCVCVVGYSDSDRAWICKNSWGQGWGEAGFFRIAYGDCGIDATMWAAEGVATPGPVGDRIPLYRYWNSGIGDHFYTTNWAELGSGRYGYGYERIQCYVANQQQTGTVPLYRYWNSGAGDHFYTTNWAELGSGRYGWGYEGIQCYVANQQQAGTVPLYRYWNPRASDHFYTTNWAELGPGRYGWGYEGIQCYVYSQAAALSGMEAASMEAPLPSTFTTQPQEVVGPPASFTVSRGGVGTTEMGPSGSFETMHITSDETSTSFQVKERRPSTRIRITVDTDPTD